jgi:hypothetical protein
MAMGHSCRAVTVAEVAHSDEFGNPSDARRTGGVPEAFSTEGMPMLQPLDDARFPLIG